MAETAMRPTATKKRRRWMEERAIEIDGTRCRVFRSPDTNVQVFVSNKKRIGHHLSISHPWRYPTWDEIAAARDDLLPHDVTMVLVLPPMDEYVNVHPNCFHLHQCRCTDGSPTLSVQVDKA